MRILTEKKELSILRGARKERFDCTNLNSLVERATVRVKCIVQEQITISLIQPGLETTNSHKFNCCWERVLGKILLITLCIMCIVLINLYKICFLKICNKLC